MYEHMPLSTQHQAKYIMIPVIESRSFSRTRICYDPSLHLNMMTKADVSNIMCSLSTSKTTGDVQYDICVMNMLVVKTPISDLKLFCITRNQQEMQILQIRRHENIRT
jgi:hypothetical protein